MLHKEIFGPMRDELTRCWNPCSRTSLV